MARGKGRSPEGRIQLIDALRGLCIILMLAYHFAVDLVMFGFIPKHIVYNKLLDTLVVVFAGTFLVLAGVSCRLSRSNLKRGLVCAVCALGVTGISVAMGQPIYFGILHLMAACMLLFWLLDKLGLVVPLALLGAFLALYYGWSWWPQVPSADYFPLLPWGYLFFLGTVLGKPIAEHRWPQGFYSARVPLLPAVGRKTLIIYLLHQPVFWGIMMAAEYIKGRVR